MARVRSPDRLKAEEMYLEHKGKIDLVDIASELDRPPGTIRGWKNKDKWDNKLNGTFQKKSDKNTERSNKKENVKSIDNDKGEASGTTDEEQSSETNSTYKGGAPKGNRNAQGNKGGMGGPEGNKKAEIHGFFAKYLPEETLELTQLIQEKPYIDILWENITIQYAAIIRAQRIMYVKDQEDSTQLIKKQKIHESDMSSSSETEYEHHMSWDKQATFLQAQSRAMSELRSMIKQYDDLVNNGLATEEQKLRIEKLKQDINNAKGIDEADNQGVQDFIQATTMSEEEIKELFEDEDDEDGEEEETD